jgi:anti-sigma B factor antagonist
MELHFSETDDALRMIRLTGRLDIIGVRQIEAEFADRCSGDDARVIVDLAGVDFLTSIGIRMLLLTSNSMASRGGKMVLLNPRELVREELLLTGVGESMPILNDFDQALEALG